MKKCLIVAVIFVNLAFVVPRRLPSFHIEDDLQDFIEANRIPDIEDIDDGAYEKFEGVFPKAGNIQSFVKKLLAMKNDP
jgi:hypothetical protein